MGHKMRPMSSDQTEIDLLREENAALRKALHNAKRALAWHVDRRAGHHDVERMRPPPTVAPMVCRDGADLVAGLRTVRQGRGLSHLALDQRIGWADGFTGKIEQPTKGWGKRIWNQAMDDLLQGLGVGLVLVDIGPRREACLPLPAAIAPDAGNLDFRPYSLRPEAVADARGQLARLGVQLA